MSSSLPMIPEILRIICEHMASHKTSLASFARTCTRIEEPALDVLWCDIDGLYPLVKCLPSNLWSEQVQEGNLRFMLQLPISLSDCSRLARYARRIRRFSSEPPEGVNKYVDASIYNGLQVALQGEKLLPNVRRLKWICSNDTVPCLQMFLGPHLVNIQFKVSASSLEQLSLLPVIFHQYPSLERFDFSFHDDPPSQTVSTGESWAINLISRSIHKFNNLEALTVAHLPHSAIRQLSLLPNLKSLAINKCNFGNNVQHQDIRGRRFQALQTLRLDSCAFMSDCLAILELMDHSPIEKIDVYMDATATQSSWEKFFVAINSHCQHHTLKHIICYDGCENGGARIIKRPRAQMVDAKILKPLLEFSNLEHIGIEIVREMFFGDISVTPKTMASSWKKLDALRMENALYSRCEEPSTITLLDLIYFAENCPKLDVLGLRIDARSTPEIDEHEFPWRRTQGSKVTELYVGDSPIGDPGVVSATLSGIFPKLECIKTNEESEGTESDNHKAWKVAQNLLKVFTSVRKQERSFAKVISTGS